MPCLFYLISMVIHWSTTKCHPITERWTKMFVAKAKLWGFSIVGLRSENAKSWHTFGIGPTTVRIWVWTTNPCTRLQLEATLDHAVTIANFHLLLRLQTESQHASIQYLDSPLLKVKVHTRRVPLKSPRLNSQSSHVRMDLVSSPRQSLSILPSSIFSG